MYFYLSLTLGNAKYTKTRLIMFFTEKSEDTFIRFQANQKVGKLVGDQRSYFFLNGLPPSAKIKCMAAG